MSFGKKLFWGIFIFSVCIEGSIVYSFETFRLRTNTPVEFEARIDVAGYSDEIFWGISDYHPHGLHELLSGEWAAAIYYDGTPKWPNAMWLTDQFKVPDWWTYCNFTVNSYSIWDDPTNPVVGYDTAQSVISNNDVEITIDYEIADLGPTQRSPLVYKPPNRAVKTKDSERYVLLQTYTIKNIKPSGNITGLEFYQMLHGHYLSRRSAAKMDLKERSYENAIINHCGCNTFYSIWSLRCADG